ncbi:hypothetical protein HDU67_002178 [Dinochytrium kinnereticum]|nr:hypothetical protein HDU67_002178 [Dinochytrium kinnereticum]
MSPLELVATLAVAVNRESDPRTPAESVAPTDEPMVLDQEPVMKTDQVAGPTVDSNASAVELIGETQLVPVKDEVMEEAAPSTSGAPAGGVPAQLPEIATAPAPVKLENFHADEIKKTPSINIRHPQLNKAEYTHSVSDTKTVIAAQSKAVQPKVPTPPFLAIGANAPEKDDFIPADPAQVLWKVEEAILVAAKNEKVELDNELVEVEKALQDLRPQIKTFQTLVDGAEALLKQHKKRLDDAKLEEAQKRSVAKHIRSKIDSLTSKVRESEARITALEKSSAVKMPLSPPSRPKSPITKRSKPLSPVRTLYNQSARQDNRDGSILRDREEDREQERGRERERQREREREHEREQRERERIRAKNREERETGNDFDRDRDDLRDDKARRQKAGMDEDLNVSRNAKPMVLERSEKRDMRWGADQTRERRIDSLNLPPPPRIEPEKLRTLADTKTMTSSVPKTISKPLPESSKENKVCYAWNASGHCKVNPCSRDHQCFRCGGKHPSYLCPDNLNAILDEFFPKSRREHNSAPTKLKLEVPNHSKAASEQLIAQSPSKIIDNPILRKTSAAAAVASLAQRLSQPDALANLGEKNMAELQKQMIEVLTAYNAASAGVDGDEIHLRL